MVKMVQYENPQKVVVSGQITIYQPTYIHPSVDVGIGTRIGAYCDIGKNVHIGKECNIQCHVTISNGCYIGDNVFIGPNTSLLNDKHMDGAIEAVIVHDNVKIGGHCAILPGVTVGANAIIGAGSIIPRDVLKGTVEYNRVMTVVEKRDSY